MEEEEDLGRVGVPLSQGEEVEVVVSDVEILVLPVRMEGKEKEDGNIVDEHAFMPSCEKHGGTAEDSSSASLRRMGNFSTADMGISPL